MAACAVQVSLHKLRRLTGLIYPGNTQVVVEICVAYFERSTLSKHIDFNTTAANLLSPQRREVAPSELLLL